SIPLARHLRRDNHANAATPDSHRECRSLPIQIAALHNPKQLDRFRDRFTVAGAKDDRRDAQVLGDSLRTDRHAFRRLSNDEPVIVQLPEWSRMPDELQQERARRASRMREQLWRYYPQMLELADDLAADW